MLKYIMLYVKTNSFFDTLLLHTAFITLLMQCATSHATQSDLLDPFTKDECYSMLGNLPAKLLNQPEHFKTCADKRGSEIIDSLHGPLATFHLIYNANQVEIAETFKDMTFLHSKESFFHTHHALPQSLHITEWSPLLNLIPVLDLMHERKARALGLEFTYDSQVNQKFEAMRQETFQQIEKSLQSGHVPFDLACVQNALYFINELLTTTNINIGIILLDESKCLEFSILDYNLALRQNTILLPLSTTFTNSHIWHAHQQNLRGITNLTLDHDLGIHGLISLVAEQLGTACIDDSEKTNLPVFLPNVASMLLAHLLGKGGKNDENNPPNIEMARDILHTLIHTHEAPIRAPGSGLHTSISLIDEDLATLIAKATPSDVLDEEENGIWPIIEETLHTLPHPTLKTPRECLQDLLDEWLPNEPTDCFSPSTLKKLLKAIFDFIKEQHPESNLSDYTLPPLNDLTSNIEEYIHNQHLPVKILPMLYNGKICMPMLKTDDGEAILLFPTRSCVASACLVNQKIMLESIILFNDGCSPEQDLVYTFYQSVLQAVFQSTIEQKQVDKLSVHDTITHENESIIPALCHNTDHPPVRSRM